MRPAVVILAVSLLAASPLHADEAPVLRFELSTPDHQRIVFPEAARGRPAVILFWATWCPFCKRLMPQLQRIVAVRRPAIEWYAIDILEDGDPVATLKERGLDPVLLLDGDRVAARLGIFGTPRLLVTDGDGRIVYVGPTTSDYAAEAAHVGEILDRLERR